MKYILLSILICTFRCSLSFSIRKIASSQKSSHRLRSSPGYTDSSPETESKLGFRNFKKVTMFTIIASTMAAKRSDASLFQSSQQDGVDEISSFRRIIADLISQLTPQTIANPIGVYSKTQFLKGNKEDSDVVLNYMEVYIKPLQTKMSRVAPTLELESTSQQRVQILPSLMKGHILELTQAIQELKADQQLREVQEIQETLDEFLSLASTKYKVQPFSTPAVLSDAQLFGPLGCEFWGKQRVEGSNACIEK